MFNADDGYIRGNVFAEFFQSLIVNFQLCFFFFFEKALNWLNFYAL